MWEDMPLLLEDVAACSRVFYFYTSILPRTTAHTMGNQAVWIYAIHLEEGGNQNTSMSRVSKHIFYELPMEAHVSTCTLDRRVQSSACLSALVFHKRRINGSAWP
jgi:hypothetical protein